MICSWGSRISYLLNFVGLDSIKYSLVLRHILGEASQKVYTGVIPLMDMSLTREYCISILGFDDID